MALFENRSGHHLSDRGAIRVAIASPMQMKEKERKEEKRK